MRCASAASQVALTAISGLQVRPAREVQGVVASGDSPVHLHYDVALVAATGSVRVGVCLSRGLLDRAALKKWSVPELALLFFLNSCVPRSQARSVFQGIQDHRQVPQDQIADH